MSKYECIVRDPEICGGQPTIRGTRVLILDILDWIKEGNSFEEIISNFPSITRQDIQEIIAYVKDMIAGEVIIYGSNENQVSTR
jgi:uncharacterized protein (DUF433 family)